MTGNEKLIDDLRRLLQRAVDGEFDDFKSELARPKMALDAELNEMRMKVQMASTTDNPALLDRLPENLQADTAHHAANALPCADGDKSGIGVGNQSLPPVGHWPTRKEIAKACCSYHLNGGDPNQPAMRWDSDKGAMQMQEFPSWEDYLHEADSVLALFPAQPKLDQEKVARWLYDNRELGAECVLAVAMPEWDAANNWFIFDMYRTRAAALIAAIDSGKLSGD